MTRSSHQNQNKLEDDPEFEASLASGVDPELVSAETDVGVGEVASEPTTPTRPPEKRPSWAGKILGHFKLLRPMGEGKMGCVIQAQDMNLNRLVALKVMRKRLPGMKEQEHVRQFMQEARAAAQIDHPNVVKIYEINQHDGWWYIAMEMLEGENLRNLVKAAGPLSPQEACLAIADAATGLAVAHELGIVHRDIKPANLMFTRQGRCKLTDFGLVHIHDPNDPFDLTNQAVGSPQFIAPEVICRQQQTPAIDIYSLGATLYYALSGKYVYPGKNLKEILRKHVNAPAPDIRDVLPECPETLAMLIKRSMSKNPGDRPSASEFAASLRVELIQWQIETSGSIMAEGSGVLLPAQHNVRRHVTEYLKTLLGSRVRLWIGGSGVAIAVIAAITVVCVALKPGGDSPGHYAPISVEYFPESKDTYGVLPAGAIPEATDLDTSSVPEFSWVGKADATGAKFVASKRGQSYYSVDDPVSYLIRYEDIMMYESESAARADGKTPAR